MPTFPFGTHVAVVEVDVETGGTRLLRLIACDDAGTIMNPLIAEGQIHGGIAQGVAQALMEEVVYDEDGTPKTTNFADYPVISAPELPRFELHPIATPTWVNELGAKGVEEIIEVPLTAEEKAALHKSAGAVKELVDVIKV